MTISTEASSPSEHLDPAAATASAAPDAAAESSTAQDSGAKSEPKLLDVLRDAVKPAEDTGTQSPASEVTKNEPAEAAKAAEEPPEPDDSKLPFNKHPRWQEVRAQRDTARTEAAAVKTKLAETEQRLQEMEPAAKDYASIETFRRNNNLTIGDIAEGLKWSALAKNDPDEAAKVLMPVVTRLMTETGRLLPQDLKIEVDEGRITEERARELSLARARGARAETRVAEVETSASQQRLADAATKLAEANQSAIVTWENERKSKDPDFDAKQSFVVDRAQLLTAKRGYPQSPADAVAIVQQAYEEVTAEMKRVMPKKAEIKRQAVASPSVEARSAPATLRDAIRAAVG